MLRSSGEALTSSRKVVKRALVAPMRVRIAPPLLLLLAACTPMQPIRSVEAVATSLAAGREQPPLTAEELRRLQTREFSAPKDITFAATMTALLDLGYRIQSADIDTGLIVASASSVERLQLDLRGIGTARQTPMASVFLEARDNSTSRVRVNLSVSASSAGDTGASAERIVREENPYTVFFEHLQDEIAARLNALPAVEAATSRAPPAMETGIDLGTPSRQAPVTPGAPSSHAASEPDRLGQRLPAPIDPAVLFREGPS